LAALNCRDLKMSSGIIGLAPRRSTSRKAIRAAAPPIPAARISGPTPLPGASISA
jgi:hypothetical protein